MYDGGFFSDEEDFLVRLSPDEDTREFRCRVIRETPKAILVDYNDDKMWLPKSQILNYDRIKGIKDANIEISEWLANKKGIQ